MLAVFYGTDRAAARDKAKKFFEDKGAEQGGVSQVTGHEYTKGQLAEMTGALSLFGGTEYFLLDTPSASTELQEDVQENLKELADSANVFVVLEGALLAAPRKKYEKHAEIIEESAADKPERFNVFQMAEALAQKDKRKMWVLLQQVRALGIPDEETIGIMWWQLKALRLANLVDTAEDANMKEYPFKKAKSALRNFKEGEVDDLAQSLLVLYHDDHKGVSDMNVQLEKWVLSI